MRLSAIVLAGAVLLGCGAPESNEPAIDQKQEAVSQDYQKLPSADPSQSEKWCRCQVMCTDGWGHFTGWIRRGEHNCGMELADAYCSHVGLIGWNASCY